MARQPSAVLSAADKKAQIALWKTELKGVTANIKTNDKLLKDAKKEYDAKVKEINKVRGNAVKHADKLQAQIDKLTSA